jgi:signal transduction histidine kinase
LGEKAVSILFCMRLFLVVLLYAIPCNAVADSDTDKKEIVLSNISKPYLLSLQELGQLEFSSSATLTPTSLDKVPASIINLFETPEKQLRFEINKANIINQNLGIEPDIILLGGTEIDVAKLFRESQISLKDQEQLIRQQKKTVLEERARIADLARKAQEQQNFLYMLGAAILLLCGMAFSIYRGYRTKQIANAKLSEQKVLLQESASQLAHANDKLKDLDRLKSLFIASMSHELRTPLNSIIGFTGIILNGMVGELEPKQKDYLSRAYRSSKHLLALISDVIDISKIESGVIDAYPESFYINHVITEVIDSAQNVKKADVELNVNNPVDIELFSDRKRVFQCILNLLSNACKYSEKGHINIFTRKVDSNVEILIEDTGIGISDEDLENLFLPFERLNSPLRVSEAGTGLGLYLTKKLTEEVLDGSLKVESKKGIGSKFYLILPLKLQQKDTDKRISILEKTR